jgi:hypothetical protein
MSQTRKEIVFSARDNGVASTMSRIKQSANELGRELVREAVANTSSAQDAVKHYEQQIRLIEKKNRLEQQAGRMRLEQNRDDQLGQKGANRSQIQNSYKEQSSSLAKGGREDQVQVDLLRELIETVKLTSHQEIRSDNKNSLRSSGGTEMRALGDAGSKFTSLSDTLHSERAGGSVGGQSQNQLGQNVARVATSMRNMANINDVAGGANAAGSMMAKANPWVAAAAAVVGAGTLLHAARGKKEMSAGQMAGLSGMNSGSIIDAGYGGTSLGGYGPNDLNISREEFLSNNIPAAMRSAGTSVGAGQRGLRHAEIEKGMALSSGTAGSIEKLTRVLEGSSTAQITAAKVYSSMYGTGALGQGNQDMSRMQDIMSGFVGFQESQFMGSGVTDGSTTLGLMRKLQQMGGSFTRDDYAIDTVSRLNSGLSQGGSPEANAMKFDVLRKLNPNKSFFELQMEMEKGVNSKGYLSGVFDFVKSTGGDDNAQSILLDELTGGGMRKTDIWDMVTGNKSIDEINREQQLQDPNFQAKALSASSQAQSQADFAKETIDDVLVEGGKWVSELVESLGNISKKLDDIF